MNHGDMMLLYVGNIFYILALGSIYTMIFMAATFVQGVRSGLSLDAIIHRIIHNTLTFYPAILFISALIFAMNRI